MKRIWYFLVAISALMFCTTLWAQTAAQQTAETVKNVNMMGQQSFASLLMSFFMPRIMEGLKNWKKFPWLQEGAAKLNRGVALLVSVLQGTGLTWAYHRAAEGSHDGWQFIIGSQHSSFEEWIIACFVAWAAQQYFYEQLPSVRADAIARAMARN